MFITLTQGEGGMPCYLAVRGTSQLEGYHHHLAELLVGANYSAYLAGALVTYFNYRCACYAGHALATRKHSKPGRERRKLLLHREGAFRDTNTPTI